MTTKRPVPLIILSVLLLATLTALSLPTRAVAASTLTVHVDLWKEGLSTGPFDGATVVSTVQPSGQAALSGTTDLSGNVVFTGIAEGDYNLSASGIHSVPVSAEVPTVIAIFAPQSAIVTVGSTPVTMTMHLNQPGILTGTVEGLDMYGDDRPMRNAVVTATGPPTLSAITDPNGHYAVSLPAGSYNVVVTTQMPYANLNPPIVTGHVYDALDASNPITGANITAVPIPPGACVGGAEGINYGNATTTDASGHFQMVLYTYTEYFSGSAFNLNNPFSITITDGVITGAETMLLAAHHGCPVTYEFTFSHAGYDSKTEAVSMLEGQTYDVNVYLNDPAPDPFNHVSVPDGHLSVVAGSPHLTARPGDTVSFSIASASTAHMNMTMSAQGVPSDWNYVFTPLTGVTSPQFASVMTITIPSAASIATYTIRVIATDSAYHYATGDVILELQSTSTTTTTTTTPRSCIIATAAYGSPMAPEVVYMRHVRDGMIGSTPTGKVLRDGWNWFYYLWSPPIAASIASSPALQASFRVLLLPLVGTIHITGWLFTAIGGSDLASVVAFGFAAFASIVSYVLLPACAVRVAWKRGKLALERK